MTDEELDHTKTLVRNEMRQNFYGETILEENIDHEEELAAAADRENAESPDNPPIEDIAMENKESEGNNILSMKMDILVEFSNVQHTEL